MKKTTPRLGRPPLRLKLKPGERQELAQLLRGGQGSVREFKRALALQLLDAGKSAPQVAESTGLGKETVRRILRRYEEGGLPRALHEAPRPGGERLLDQRAEARIIAMVCSKPPEGFSRWSLSLIVNETIARGIIGSISDDTINRLLHRHDIKPWREKNVVRRRA